MVAKAQKTPDEGWSMQDGTAWPGNNPRDHPGMIQVKHYSFDCVILLTEKNVQLLFYYFNNLKQMNAKLSCASNVRLSKGPTTLIEKVQFRLYQTSAKFDRMFCKGGKVLSSSVIKFPLSSGHDHESFYFKMVKDLTVCA